MRWAETTLLFCLLTGCAAADPCRGQPSGCIVVEADGPFRQLSSLQGRISGVRTQPLNAAISAPGTFDLPVEFAALLPAALDNALLVELTAVRDGQ